MILMISVTTQAETKKEYHDNGIIKSETTLRGGKIIAQKKYNRNGDIEYELQYENNQKFETTIKYYPTGEKFRIRDGKFANGRFQEGIETDYHKDGSKKAERNYKNGVKEGSAKGYYYTGTVQGDWKFKNGEPIAADIFYRNGAIWLKHTDFNDKGQLHGVSKEYNKKGTLIALRYYTENEMIKRKKVGFWLRWFWTIWY
jgi:antitoxin component YwqK of YwqJK toxin-antitoxin module